MGTQLGCVYVIYDKVNLEFLFGETGRDGDKRLVEHMGESEGREREKPAAPRSL